MEHESAQKMRIITLTCFSWTWVNLLFNMKRTNERLSVEFFVDIIGDKIGYSTEVPLVLELSRILKFTNVESTLCFVYSFMFFFRRGECLHHGNL